MRTAWDSAYRRLEDADPGADPDHLEFCAHLVCQADITLEDAQRILRSLPPPWHQWVGPAPDIPGDMI